MQYIDYCNIVLLFFYFRSSPLSKNPFRHVHDIFYIRSCSAKFQYTLHSSFAILLLAPKIPAIKQWNIVSSSRPTIALHHSCHLEMNVGCWLADFTITLVCRFTASSQSVLSPSSLLSIGIFSLLGSNNSTNIRICPIICFTTSFMFLPVVSACLF